MREVVHYWFTGWPDYGVPDSTASFVNFTSEARKMISQQDSLVGLQTPVVVHCRFVSLIDLKYNCYLFLQFWYQPHWSVHWSTCWNGMREAWGEDQSGHSLQWGRTEEAWCRLYVFLHRDQSIDIVLNCRFCMTCSDIGRVPVHYNSWWTRATCILWQRKLHLLTMSFLRKTFEV